MRNRHLVLAPALVLAALMGALVVGAAAPVAVRVVPGNATAAGLSRAEKAAGLHFVSATGVDFVKLLPAPPKVDTAEAKADLEMVLSVQKTRTEAEVERAKGEAKLKMTAFTGVVGPWFTPGNLPLTEALILEVEKDSKYFSGGAKDFFGRKRPPNDARVTPVIDDKDEPSYPSGHATRGILFASVIAELDPEQREALMDRAREIGWDRVIAGVHYPSDIVAGRVPGQALAQAMAGNEKFQGELAAAKVEFAAAKKKYGGEEAAKQ